MVRGAGEFLDNRFGSTAIEYALIAALVVVAMIGGLSTVGGNTNDMYDQVGDQVDAAHNGSE